MTKLRLISGMQRWLNIQKLISVTGHKHNEVKNRSSQWMQKKHLTNSPFLHNKHTLAPVSPGAQSCADCTARTTQDFKCVSLTQPPSARRRNYNCTHFIQEVTEAQRG